MGMFAAIRLHITVSTSEGDTADACIHMRESVPLRTLQMCLNFDVSLYMLLQPCKSTCSASSVPFDHVADVCQRRSVFNTGTLTGGNVCAQRCMCQLQCQSSRHQCRLQVCSSAIANCHTMRFTDLHASPCMLCIAGYSLPGLFIAGPCSRCIAVCH